MTKKKVLNNNTDDVNSEVEIEFNKEKFVNSAKVAWDFFLKYKIYVLVLLLIPLIVSFNLRIAPANLDVTQNWARDTVYGQQKAQIEAGIRSQFPNMDQARVNQLVNQQFNDLMNNPQMSSQMQSQIDGAANYFKSRFQDENGQTYLVAIDPYTYLRESENIVKYGHAGTEIKDGKSFDPKPNAPAGRFRSVTFHSLMTAWIYKILTAIGVSTTVFSVAFFMPIIFSVLAVIPAFFLGRRFGGNIGGFFAGLVVAIHPVYLTRTIGGFSDTDAYNVLFPLLIACFLFEALSINVKKEGFFSKLLEKIKLKKKTYSDFILAGILALFAGFFVGVFAYAWTGWWYVFDFLLVTVMGVLIYTLFSEYIKNKKSIMKRIKSREFLLKVFILIIFIVSSGIFVSIMKSPTNFFNGPLAPLGFTKIKDVGSKSIWPNVYTTVAELNTVSHTKPITDMGGLSGLDNNLLLMVLVTLGVSFSAIIFKKKKSTNWSNLLFFIVWTLGILGMIGSKSSITNLIIVLIIALIAAIWAKISYSVKDKYMPDTISLVGSLLWLIAIRISDKLLFIPNMLSPISFSTQAMILFIGVLGIIAIILYNLIVLKNDVNPLFMFLYVVWMAGTFYASSKGVRFIMLMMPIFAIGFGIALKKLYDYFTVLFAKGLADKILSSPEVLNILVKKEGDKGDVFIKKYKDLSKIIDCGLIFKEFADNYFKIRKVDKMEGRDKL